MEQWRSTATLMTPRSKGLEKRELTGFWDRLKPVTLILTRRHPDKSYERGRVKELNGLKDDPYV